MSIFLGAIRNTNVENSKAYVEYKIKGRKKYVYFKNTSDASNFYNLMRKKIKKGMFREIFEDLKVKSF